MNNLTEFWQNLTNRAKIILIFILSLSIIIPITIFILTTFYRSGKTKITIEYAPFISNVKINNKTYKNDSSSYIEPGHYTIVVSLDEFDTLTTEIDIEGSEQDLYGSLNFNSTKGKEIQEKYINDYYKVESFAAKHQAKLGDEEREKWPIITELPINNALFSLGYTLSNENLTLNISASDTYLNDAINKLKTLDKNLSQYNIIIKEFNNNFNITPTTDTSNNPIEFIKNSYKNSTKDFTIGQGKAIKNYYITTLSTGSDEQYDLVTYRIILKKNNNSWKITSTPYPILTIHNTKNIDQEILNQANNL